jgi:OmpA-OmpF porin, OOP family
MVRKSWLISSIAIIPCITSSFAAAAYTPTGTDSTYCTPGFYAGLQGGRGDTSYKKTDLTIPTNAFNNSIGAPTVANENISEVGMAGRVFAGYQFNPYFATELGYTQFNKTSFTAQGNYVMPASSQNTLNTVYQGTVTEKAADLVGKATMPIPGGLGAYVKAGIALVCADQVINTSTAINNTPAINYVTSDQTYQALRPVYGAGIDYTIPNTPVDIDVSWTRIHGNAAIPHADLAAVGINYKFA